jgi:glutathione S-transferase
VVSYFSQKERDDAINSKLCPATASSFVVRRCNATSRKEFSMKMKLYEFGPTRSIRARWTLQELGVDFEPIRVNLLAGEHRRPEFLEINPAGKIPVLVDGDLVLTESVAIVLYLAEKYSDKGLLPAGFEERAQVNRWLLFAATELEQPLWRISRHTALYSEEQRLRGDVILASGEFKEMASVLEKHMQGRQFVAGDSVTVADFVMAYTLDWGNEAKLLDGCPGLLAYMKRMYARPHAPPRIAEAFAAISPEQNSARGDG